MRIVTDLDEAVVKQIDVICEHEDKSRSKIVRLAVREWLPGWLEKHPEQRIQPVEQGGSHIVRA